MQLIYLPPAYHLINQPIYQLRTMQSTSTVEADNKVILFLVNLYVQLLLLYTICKQLSEYVSMENQCAKRVFL